MMRRRVILGSLPLIVLLMALSYDCHSESRPFYPYKKAVDKAVNLKTAKELYECARQENPRLRWDNCLSDKALNRAKDMVKRGYFSHQDPATGKNPAWQLVRSCHRSNCAGENISKGYEAPRMIHDSFMESPSHRKNILDPRFNLMGVGCYEDICVELFAGL